MATFRTARETDRTVLAPPSRHPPAPSRHRGRATLACVDRSQAKGLHGSATGDPVRAVAPMLQRADGYDYTTQKEAGAPSSA